MTMTDKVVAACGCGIGWALVLDVCGLKQQGWWMLLYGIPPIVFFLWLLKQRW